jgi:hypothetical protein
VIWCDTMREYWHVFPAFISIASLIRIQKVWSVSSHLPMWRLVVYNRSEVIYKGNFQRKTQPLTRAEETQWRTQIEVRVLSGVYLIRWRVSYCYVHSIEGRRLSAPARPHESCIVSHCQNPINWVTHLSMTWHLSQRGLRNMIRNSRNTFYLFEIF